MTRARTKNHPNDLEAMYGSVLDPVFYKQNLFVTSFNVVATHTHKKHAPIIEV